MKLICYISTMLLAAGMLPFAQAQNTNANSAITPGSAILASLASQNNTAGALHRGDTISDSQSAAGYQLTGQVLLQLSAATDFTALAANYNLQLQQAYGTMVVVTAPDTDLKQLVAQLAQEPAILKVSYDLRELGLSPDPQVKNNPN